MPIDPSIIAGLKTPVFQAPDPLEQYSKSLTLQGLMGQQQLQGLKTQEAQQTLNDDQATRNAYTQAGGDSDRLRALLSSGGQYKALQNLDKFNLEKQEKESSIGLNTAKTATQGQEALAKAAAMHRDELTNVTDPQSAAQWVVAGFNDPILKPVLSRAGTPDDVIAKIPTDPQGFQQWKQQAALGATKFIEMNAPKINVQNTGGASNIVATPGLGGAPTVLSSTPMTATPGEVMGDATRKSEGAANRAVTLHGQALTDARARELNGIMEGQGPADLKPTAKAIAHHDLPMPAPPSGSRNPMAMVRYNELLKSVKEENPTYNAQDYPVSQAAYRSFQAGPQSKEVESANIGLNHLDTIQRLAQAQKNGDIQLFNRIANDFGTAIGKPAPTNLASAVTMVAPEITKAVVGAGGGVEDRNKSAAALDPKKSPDQMIGTVQTMKELFSGRLSEKERTYERSTMRHDFREKFLSPAAQEVLKSRTVAAPAATDAPAAPTQADIDAELRRRGLKK